MQFIFNEMKAAQAAAVLLKQTDGGWEDNIKLLTLLYLADRESLLETGSPISGAFFINTKNGPVSSDIYQCFQEPNRTKIWKNYIQRFTYTTSLIKNPRDGELSDYDIDTLESLYNQFKTYYSNNMISYSRNLPEWKDPGNMPFSLDPEDILRANKIDEERIQEFLELNNTVMELERKIT